MDLNLNLNFELEDFNFELENLNFELEDLNIELGDLNFEFEWNRHGSWATSWNGVGLNACAHVGTK